MQYPRREFDIHNYNARVRAGRCFVCQIVDGTIDHPHDIVFGDEFAIAFLSRYPTVLGYTIVAPLEHRRGVLSDFSAAEYLRLQSVVYRVGKGVESAVPTERLYVLSLGSNQGNSHVHWHIAPLPAGIPYEQQQLRALDATYGYLDVPPKDSAELAKRIVERIPAS